LENNGHYVPSLFFNNGYNNEFFSFVFGREQNWGKCGYDDNNVAGGEDCKYDMAGDMFTHLFSNM
jgi:hypothetical protein